MSKKDIPKKLLSLLLLIFLTGKVANAQQDTSNTYSAGKNLVKINLAALVLKTYSFQYERAIGGKTSVAMGFRIMPKSAPPFKSTIEDLVDDPEAWSNIEDFKTGNYAFTPEVRFYLGKNVFRGFYIAPFVRIAKYDADIPFKYTYSNFTEVLPFSGSVNTVTGGLLFGAQWKLSKSIYLDWWILGPNYGTASGNFSATRTLNAIEQEVLRNELTNLDDVPLIKTKYTVDGNGAKIDVDGNWAGVRGGLNIGFRF